jgi:hypothetical protein
VPITSGLDVSGLPGLQVYAGYGLSLDDMLAGGKFGLVYALPEH